MKFLTIQEAYQRKFNRQNSIKALEYHAAGQCVHIGKISPGCLTCFLPKPFYYNILTSIKCNLNCPYCFQRSSRIPDRHLHSKTMAQIISHSKMKAYDPVKVSFSGWGEPLLCVDIIEEYMKLFRKIEIKTGKRPWSYIYTNGILAGSNMLVRLRDLGFDEIRFHLGASNFSKRVYKNVREAVKLFKAVTIETPSWPPHRDKLFEMLPIINDMGVRHLNLGEVEVTEQNYAAISKILPKGEIYPCHMVHLYDQGLVYDIIEEVLKRRYCFSVLDCSCFVKNIQRSPAKWTAHQPVRGLSARY